jgi:hypothetical protein
MTKPITVRPKAGTALARIVDQVRNEGGVISPVVHQMAVVYERSQKRKGGKTCLTPSND